jgi:hypothetical protein
MKYRNLFFALLFLGTPNVVFGACSIANLTRCLDSVCAINIGANPAARCQYCGDASAGEPAKSSAMKSISAGASAKYTISDKELKKAPKDPGERYIWATRQCLDKLTECSADDVSDNYDSLIEQSCKAAGISAEFTNLAQEINEEKTKSSCSSEITSCLIHAKRCNADYSKCESDADFDRYYAECSVLSTGCESFSKDIRSTLIANRDNAVKNADKILKTIVTAYQTSRENKLKNIQDGCKDSAAKKKCISTVCNNNMRHKCELGFEYEETLAGMLCKFYDTACDRLK